MAELLIALLILGQIATFTIPKILYTSQNTRNRTVLKETVGMLTTVAYHAVLMNEITSTTDVSSYFATKINYVKHCQGPSNDQGCWNTAIQGTYFAQENQYGGFILHNGAVIAGMGGAANGRPNSGTANQMFAGFVIDVNGTDGPNLQGIDIFDANICIGPNPCETSLASKYGAKAPGLLVSGNSTFVEAFQ